MDLITSHLIRNRPCSFGAYYSIVQSLYNEFFQQFISYERLVEISEQVLQTNSAEVSHFYAGLVYETCLIPKFRGFKHGVVLDMKLFEGPQREMNLLEKYIQPFHRRNIEVGGKFMNYINTLKQEGRSFLLNRQQPRFEQIAAASHHSVPTALNIPQPASSLNLGFSSAIQTNQTLMTPLEVGQRIAKPLDFENDQFIAKFLASIRRSGMDVIFPQKLHDKLLLAIYLAAKLLGPLTHRELMEAITIVKNVKVLGNDLNSISRTKMRGLVTLSRNAHGLTVVEKGEGESESAKLYIGQGIEDFTAFRQRHDAFLNLCIVQRHLYIPEEFKPEITWPSYESQVVRHFAALSVDELTLTQFFEKEKDQLPPRRCTSIHTSPTSSVDSNSSRGHYHHHRNSFSSFTSSSNGI